jgi:hypothetical protein
LFLPSSWECTKSLECSLPLAFWHQHNYLEGFCLTPGRECKD